jgi:hypothetical protein
MFPTRREIIEMTMMITGLNFSSIFLAMLNMNNNNTHDIAGERKKLSKKKFVLLRRFLFFVIPKRRDEKLSALRLDLDFLPMISSSREVIEGQHAETIKQLINLGQSIIKQKSRFMIVACTNNSESGTCRGGWKFLISADEHQ